MKEKPERNGGFRVICPECGSENVEVDAYLKESMLTYSKHIALPRFYCEDCGVEWNSTLTRAAHL